MDPEGQLFGQELGELELRYGAGFSSGASASSAGSDALDEAFFFVCFFGSSTTSSTLGRSNCPAFARARSGAGKHLTQ
jgi:hypothetical protein